MDEMDLMKKMRDVPSPGPEAYDRARTALQAAMAEPAENTVVRPKRWFSWPKVSVAALGAAAAVTAVVIATTTGGGGGAPTAPQVAAPQVVESPLVKLASDVKAGPQTGDSSLIIRFTKAPDGSPYVFYTVYTDKGQKFYGDSPQTLRDAAAKGDDLMSEYDRTVLDAARLAATGDLEQAKNAMVNATIGWALGKSDAEKDKAWAEAQADRAEVFRLKGLPVPPPQPRPTGKELEEGINHTLWSSATYALFIGAANADVRAGVLKLVSTIGGVKIGKAEVDGKAALTLSAPPGVQGGDTGDHVVTVDAGNGLPIRSEVVPDTGTSVANYKSSRVDFADIVAGKF
ncbi:hypothetical protein [Lentzea sp. NPDC003310]|uniref:hypothetical protein n=1 Tax=Lentzea sp. NPDC003310 TaxID=3154447 RepID=UPI0033BBE51D